MVPDHYEEYAVFGAFFAAVALGQGAWAFIVLRGPSRLVRGAGVALSAGLIALWVLSRTAGVPVGPHPWEAEPAAVLDVAACVAELGIIVVVGLSHAWPVGAPVPARRAAR